MNDTATCYNNSPHTEPSTFPFNLANYVSNIISDQTLSKNASATLVQLTLSAGSKGHCELLIYSIAVKIKSSRTQTKLYLKELQEKKRIKIIYRTGRSSIYQLLDILPEKVGPSRFSDYIKDIKKRKNQRSERTKSNVIFNFPEKTKTVARSEGGPTEQIIAIKPALHEEINTVANAINNTDPALKTVNHQKRLNLKKSNTATNTAFDMSLVREILDVTGDKKSLGCFIRIVRNVPKNIIFAALSSLKIAMSEEMVARPGGYFVATIKNYCPDVFCSPKTCTDSPVTKNNSIIVPLGTSKQSFEPEDNIVPATQEFAMQAINKIKSILNKRWINLR